MEIDLMPIITPILTVVFMLVGIGLTAAAGWAMKKYGDKLTVQEQEAMKKEIDKMIVAGVRLAKKKTLAELEKSSISKTNIDNPQIAFVVNYVVNHVPEYIAKLNIDEDRLINLIESKF